MDPKDAEIARLKGLLGRYAKHMAFTATPEPKMSDVDHRARFYKTSPWVTWEELREIEGYL